MSREEGGTGGFWGGLTLTGVVSWVLVQFFTIALIFVFIIASTIILFMLWYYWERLFLGHDDSPLRNEQGQVVKDKNGVAVADPNKENKSDYLLVIDVFSHTIYGFIIAWIITFAFCLFSPWGKI